MMGAFAFLCGVGFATFVIGGVVVLWHVSREPDRAELPPATARQIRAARHAKRLRIEPRQYQAQSRWVPRSIDDLNDDSKEYR